MHRGYYIEVIKWLRVFSKKNPLDLTRKEALDIRRLSRTNDKVSIEIVLDELINMGILAQRIDHQFEVLFLTALGKEWVVALANSGELLTNQKKHIANYFLAQLLKKNHILDFFQLFQFDINGNFFIKKIILNDQEAKTARELVDFEILSSCNESYVLDKNLLDKVLNVINASGISEEKLCEKLEKLRKIGLDGEQWVVQFEKHRLEDKYPGCESRVERVSEKNVALGYDVHSIAPSLEERFIEVKTCSTNKITFYLSNNEIKKSEKYGNSYWLYILVGKQESKDPKDFYRIQNPARFLKEKNVTLQPVLFEVTFDDGMLK
ncbi:hypothetical protein SPFL3102_00592 [Sporomusaceae bacterium FL31]|nr:hypothetical protein SPFL3101_01359 [Sporomusaceae bacterium FL31]GCE32795.1 hypothetical protein SPFL3102_00592 [Sporomusaceae bacterium]